MARMEHCVDEAIIGRFSGKTLLGIAGPESTKWRQKEIESLLENIDARNEVERRG